MRGIRGDIIWRTEFTYPWRIFLSGSSGSGKTRFAGDLLQNQHLFEEEVESVVYYHPCYLEEPPVRWHEQLNIPVSYRVGLPTKDDLMSLHPNTCVVLDDLYDDAVKSGDIDHLFRVISGKNKICVMIMTQNNFAQGKHGRDIRNSCNFTVLFRNCCDSSINKRVCSMAGLKKAYTNAESSQISSKYPYLFLDQSPQGQLSPYRLYTDIFSKYKTVFHSETGMKGYVISESDFKQIYKILEKNQSFEARRKNAKQNNKNTKVRTDQTTSEDSDSSRSIVYYESDSSNSSSSSDDDRKRRHRKNAGKYLHKYQKRSKF